MCDYEYNACSPKLVAPKVELCLVMPGANVSLWLVSIRVATTGETSSTFKNGELSNVLADVKKGRDWKQWSLIYVERGFLTMVRKCKQSAKQYTRSTGLHRSWATTNFGVDRSLINNYRSFNL